MVVIPSQARISTATGNTSVTKVRKTRVFLEYPCYICGNILSGAKSAIGHANRIHGFDIPTRMVGRKRPQDDDYEYVRDRNSEVDEIHYSCSSCWFHCPEYEDNIEECLRILNAHVREEHDPVKVDITKDGDDVTRVGSRNNSRQNSVDPSSVERGSGNANRGQNQTSDSGGSRQGKSNGGGNRSSQDDRSQGDRSGSNNNRGRSTTPNGTPITEESAKEISSKLDELTDLFRRFFSSQK